MPGEVLLHRVSARYLFTLVTALALIVLAAGPATVFAQIELDGDARKNTGLTVGGTDWDEILLGNGGGAVARTTLVIDRPEPSFAQFTGGGSKDEQDIPNWKYRNGTPLSKDDLSHAYAAAFKRASDNHFILAFGMDRYDTSGNAQLGFWFLQDHVQPVSGGTFSGHHIDGYLLVLVNFANGGTVPIIQVLKWSNGALVPQGIGGSVLCSGGSIPTSQDFCGITNATAVPAPWTYENKDLGVTGSFPPGAFFEGAVDLTDLNLTACFTNFLAESRSSTSITAILKDFATPSGGFNVCSITVDKFCESPKLDTDQTHIIYTIRGTVTNNGFGTLYNVDLSDSPAADNANAFSAFDCETQTPSGIFPLTSLNGNASVCYKATMTVPLTSNGISDTVTVTANSESDLSSTVLTKTAQATCPNLPVNPALTVSKDCTTAVEVSNNQVRVKVNVTGEVCNTGDSNLYNVKVEDLNISTSPNPLFFQAAALAAGQCKTYNGTYIPSTTNGKTDPAVVDFTDMVKATAVDILGRAVPNKNTVPLQPDITDSATCPLCPKCPTCTPTP